jgi:hypothetical protein
MPCLQFTVFTIILLRASIYSLAAFLSARFSVQHNIGSESLNGLEI